MKIIGLTGGIGSGKSTVAQIFKTKYNIPIYLSDLRAKEIMINNKEVKSKIIKLLGNEAYDKDLLNTKYVAEKIFCDKSILEKQNKIVHPVVKKDFDIWKKKQNSALCINESAIIFESNFSKYIDYSIVVTSDDDIRIKRIIKRNNYSIKHIQNRLKNQWSQDELIRLSDFHIINNTNIKNLEFQVDKIMKIMKLLVN